MNQLPVITITTTNTDMKIIYLDKQKLKLKLMKKALRDANTARWL